MTPLPAPLRWLHSLEWRRGFFDWARSDGVTWVYIFKVLIAAFLTLWLAMRLELPQPRTAMITVFIVMQPQSGQVFAKSFYRFLGTLAGSAVMVLLIALFAQNTELFLGALAIWVGVCTAGATRNRNFRAYGFVLAGYTAAMVGLPALAHPDGAFMAAVWRVLEISLGILCATLVSAAILPQTSSAAMRNALYQRFGTFALFVTDGLRGRSQREGFESSNVRFIAEAVGLEGLRSVTVFEDPHMRRRNGRLSRLNSEFMGITTRFNALHQLLERLRSDAADHVVAAIKPGLQDLAELLDGFSGRALTSPDAARLVSQLTAYKESLPAKVRSLRAMFQESSPSDAEQLDFHTAYELLYRFVDDLHNYAQTHASLAEHSHAREHWDESYTPKTNWLACAASGIRASFILLVLGSYWVATAWPSGATMTLIAAATVGLSAATPNPKRMAFQMACGTLIGAVVGFVEMFFVFPWIDGFPLLCVMLAPVIVLGAFLSSRPQYAGVGLGLLIFFSTGSVPDNLTIYNPYTFINDYIAMIIGMLVCAAAGRLSCRPTALGCGAAWSATCVSKWYMPSAASSRAWPRVLKAAPATCCTRPMAWPPASHRCNATCCAGCLWCLKSVTRSLSCARNRRFCRCTRRTLNPSPGARPSGSWGVRWCGCFCNRARATWSAPWWRSITPSAACRPPTNPSPRTSTPRPCAG